MITAPQLFAGIKFPEGWQSCYYCGGQCAEDHLTADYVKPTFTNRDIVRRPASPYGCKGCVACFTDRDITLIDGENRKDQWTRLYSWVFTETVQIAATKAHLKELTHIILNPPEPPFGIVLATSGQKQLLFRSFIAWDRENFPLLLEDECIMVSPIALAERIALAKRVIAAIGKPGLAEIGFQSAIRFCDYYENLEDFYSWQLVMHEPLSRLAAYLSPSQKDCRSVTVAPFVPSKEFDEIWFPSSRKKGPRK
jgi:CRISPR type IV-associated protein Csf1